jgi:hypothetical protein
MRGVIDEEEKLLWKTKNRGNLKAAPVFEFVAQAKKTHRSPAVGETRTVVWSCASEGNS